MIARFVLTLSCLTVAGCGYHISGHADALPKTIHTIAVPAFGNITTRYKLSDSLPAAITREFITRTRYQVVTNEDEADAVLKGAVLNFLTFPSVVDQATGRSTGIQVIVYVQLNVLDRKSGKLIYSQPSMEVRQRYEIAVNPDAYFEESDTALERVSRDVARTVVSAVLEAF